jgi:hypothetical protein
MRASARSGESRSEYENPLGETPCRFDSGPGQSQTPVTGLPTRSLRISRPLAAALTCLAGSAIADQSHVGYSLAAGASKTIAVPAQNTPIQISCTQNTIGNVGEGEAAIIRSTTDVLLDWVGIDYATGAVSRGFSSVAGTHIIYCDFSGNVAIEVASATGILIKNNYSSTQSGEIMFVF